jgi:ELWxxDGT repeat protein
MTVYRDAMYFSADNGVDGAELWRFDGARAEMVANIVALGAPTQLTSLVSPKSMETAVLGRVPKGTEKLNRDALKAGINAAGGYALFTGCLGSAVSRLFDTDIGSDIDDAIALGVKYAGLNVMVPSIIDWSSGPPPALAQGAARSTMVGLWKRLWSSPMMINLAIIMMFMLFIYQIIKPMIIFVKY